MFADSNSQILGGLAILFRKIWKQLYLDVSVNTDGINLIQKAKKYGSIIYLPTHRSYIDFLILSYMCYHRHIPIPYIAAGEDFLGIALVRYFFRKAGAFFLRRSFNGDRLYTAIFSTYVTQLLIDSQALEFFIEGTRSRSGKMLHPKLGLLNIVTASYLDQKTKNCILVPISINYERTMESNLYSSELEGNKKHKETLSNLFKSRSVLQTNFGQISIHIDQPIYLNEYTKDFITFMNLKGYIPKRYIPNLNYTLIDNNNDQQIDEILNENNVYNPYTIKKHRYHFNRQLGYLLVYRMNCISQAHPTHLVATLLLQYRNGITRNQLIKKVHWLYQQIIKRNGYVIGIEMNNYYHIIDNAIKHLGNLIIQRSEKVYEANINSRDDYKNMLALGLYRNKISHLFYLEGLFATVYYALTKEDLYRVNNPNKISTNINIVPKEQLIKEVYFLHTLLHREFIYTSNIDQIPNMKLILQNMINNNIFQVHNNKYISITSNGEKEYAFLCSIIWPFIDSYYIASLLLISLQSKGVIAEHILPSRIQWLATSLYHEQMICFYESCSMDTLKNTFIVLKKLNIIETFYDTNLNQNLVRLTKEYDDEIKLKNFVSHIGNLRKEPPIKKNMIHKNLIAEIPILAKL